jgi:hypothetical protein
MRRPLDTIRIVIRIVGMRVLAAGSRRVIPRDTAGVVHGSWQRGGLRGTPHEGVGVLGGAECIFNVVGRETWNNAARRASLWIFFLFFFFVNSASLFSRTACNCAFPILLLGTAAIFVITSNVVLGMSECLVMRPIFRNTAGCVILFRSICSSGVALAGGSVGRNCSVVGKRLAED